MAGPVENSAGLLLPATWYASTVCADSFAGPGEKFVAQPATVCGPASSSTVWFAPFVNDGTSLTGVTVIVKETCALVSTPPFDVPPLSWTVATITALPFAFADGV